MFKIKSLQIYENCRNRKILKADNYLFETQNVGGFYGENISLHAIVGKNGSGKSTLLDIILKIANNLGAIVLKNKTRNAAENLNYVLGLYVDLRYDIENEDGSTKVCLCVRDRAMWIEYSESVAWLSDEWLLGGKIMESEAYEECRGRNNIRNGNFGIWDDRNFKLISDLFFYTIATNYSMLGFLSPDYDEERSLYYTRDKNEGGKTLATCSWHETRNWINGLFHKNDGYMCPVVLNPYRDNAVIDMGNEANLTAQRLTALLICEDDAMRLIPDYELDGIIFEYKESFMHNFKYAKGGLNRDDIIKIFLDRALDYSTYASTILDVLECPVDNNQPKMLTVLAMYIVQKVLNIAKKYPVYSDSFMKIGDIDNTFMHYESADEEDNARELAKYVKRHSSHIELKVHQARDFYIWAKSNLNKFEKLGEEFNYAKYKELRELPDYTSGNIPECMLTLPPAIFKQQIYLKRKRKDGGYDAEIPLWRLSSGERQLIYQLSTILYHLYNLRSVNSDMIMYKNINIVLDEMEICYHPDYQRQFIKRFIDLLKATGLNRTMYFNILLTTHSPFVLSDVLSTQILYLRNGEPVKGEERDGMVKPFAANVNDIIKQSFFMEDGFVGEFAKEKINSLVDFLTRSGNSEEWNEKSIDMVIDNIGEPLVERQLRYLASKRIESYKESYIRWLQSEIDRLGGNQ